MSSSFFQLNQRYFGPKLYTIELHQDDPAKCTSAKMRKMGFSHAITSHRIGRNSLVLNPFAETTLLKADSSIVDIHGLVVIDCSWVNAVEVFRRRIKGTQRKLPVLLAGNPVNYSKRSSLSSLEATAASLYIMGYFELSHRLLSLYKWGETFLTLNREPLDEYAKAESVTEINEIERSYFP